LFVLHVFYSAIYIGEAIIEARELLGETFKEAIDGINEIAQNTTDNEKEDEDNQV